MELCNFFRNFEGWEGGEVPPGIPRPGSLTHCHGKKVKINVHIFGLFRYSSYVSSVIREIDMKLGLVRMNGERVIGVQYFESKFSRELGEKLRINGVEWRVGVIAEDKNSIIKVLNEIVRIENSLRKKENSLRRMEQRERDREIDAQITQMFIQAYKSVMNR